MSYFKPISIPIVENLYLISALKNYLPDSKNALAYRWLIKSI